MECLKTLKRVHGNMRSCWNLCWVYDSMPIGRWKLLCKVFLGKNQASLRFHKSLVVSLKFSLLVLGGQRTRSAICWLGFEVLLQICEDDVNLPQLPQTGSDRSRVGRGWYYSYLWAECLQEPACHTGQRLWPLICFHFWQVGSHKCFLRQQLLAILRPKHVSIY